MSRRLFVRYITARCISWLVWFGLESCANLTIIDQMPSNCFWLLFRILLFDKPSYITVDGKAGDWRQRWALFLCQVLRQAAWSLFHYIYVSFQAILGVPHCFAILVFVFVVETLLTFHLSVRPPAFRLFQVSILSRLLGFWSMLAERSLEYFMSTSL